jgi:predicted Zn-dependent protease
MLGRIESELELAGILAHELAHSQHGTRTARTGAIEIALPRCVFGSSFTPMMRADEMHDEEVRATADGVRHLKLANYNPLAALKILSQLAYENPS